MSCVKDFILDDSQINCAAEAQPNARKKTTPDIEVVFVSGPDWAIRRKTKTSSRILVFMTSKNQFYIKNEKTGDIDMVNRNNLQGFLRGVAVPLQDDEGNYPFWLTQLEGGKIYLDSLMNVVTNDSYREALTTGLVYLTESSNKGGLKIKELLGEAGVKRLFSMLNPEQQMVFRWAASTSRYYYERTIPCRVLDDNKIIHLARSLSGHEYDYGARGARTYKGGPDFCIDTNSIRRMVEMYIESPATEFPCNISRVLYTNEGERRLDEGKVIEHVFTSGIEQGYGDNLKVFCSCWCDYLDQQMDVYGKIVDKYPDNLASAEHRLAYTYRKRKEIVDQELFDLAAEDMKQYRVNGEEFIITSPEKPVDLIDEGRQMSNCIGGYAKSIINNGTKIFFLRKASKPESPFVDIEIRPDGRLGQVLARFNKRPPRDAFDFVNDWYRNNFVLNEA